MNKCNVTSSCNVQTADGVLPKFPLPIRILTLGNEYFIRTRQWYPHLPKKRLKISISDFVRYSLLEIGQWLSSFIKICEYPFEYNQFCECFVFSKNHFLTKPLHLSVHSQSRAYINLTNFNDSV